MKELNQMCFSELEAARTFTQEQLFHYQYLENKALISRWTHHLAVVQQHINKKISEYFNEPISF